MKFYIDLYLFSQYLLTAIAPFESQQNVKAIKLFAVSKYNNNFFIQQRAPFWVENSLMVEILLHWEVMSGIFIFSLSIDSVVGFVPKLKFLPMSSNPCISYTDMILQQIHMMQRWLELNDLKQTQDKSTTANQNSLDDIIQKIIGVKSWIQLIFQGL